MYLSLVSKSSYCFSFQSPSLDVTLSGRCLLAQDVHFWPDWVHWLIYQCIPQLAVKCLQLPLLKSILKTPLGWIWGYIQDFPFFIYILLKNSFPKVMVMTVQAGTGQWVYLHYSDIRYSAALCWHVYRCPSVSTALFWLLPFIGQFDLWVLLSVLQVWHRDLWAIPSS